MNQFQEPAPHPLTHLTAPFIHQFPPFNYSYFLIFFILIDQPNRFFFQLLFL